MVNKEAYRQLIAELKPKNVSLIAVSKTKSVEEIKELYDLGQRDFGENYVQELVEKQKQLPKDIRWHFIGHLQSNKVKQIIGLVHLIHGVDSYKLLQEINKQSQKLNKVTNCLLQMHIAQEETKFGLSEDELTAIMFQLEEQPLRNIEVKGLMGMASFTENVSKIKEEFHQIKMLQAKLSSSNYQLPILSMGMTADYKIAMEEG